VVGWGAAGRLEAAVKQAVRRWKQKLRYAVIRGVVCAVVEMVLGVT
jgi:hypothetical protein